MKRVISTIFILLSSLSLHGQWITGFYQPSGGATGEPVSAIPWNKYTHMQLFSAGAGSNGVVCLGYMAQSDINAFLASKPAGKKALVTLGDAPGGYTGADGITCGTGTTWAANTGSTLIATFVQNIVNFVNQTGQNNGGFDGVDLDWEGSVNSTQYADLINRLRAAMPNKVINIDVYPGAPTAAAAAAQASLDQVNVMGYDGGNFTNYSWYNGPIFPYVANQSSSIYDKVYQTGGPDLGAVSAGVAPAKVGVGMPFYGYRWTGCTQALVTGCSRQGYFSYGNLVKDTTRWQSQYQRYDTTYKSNYLSISSLNEFDTYNGVEFMPDVVAWAKANGLGGYMTYTQNDEYVSTQTGDARYPLSTALYNAVFGGAPTISTTTLAGGTVGAVYSQTLTGTNVTTWSIASGALPAGLSLNSSTGAITGTPATAGTFSFTVQASNSIGSATKALSIAISAASGIAPAITTTSLASATVGVAYSQTLVATGTTPITWSISSGSLPSGLSLNATTGAITGTPTASGTASFTANATNSWGTSTVTLSIAVNPALLTSTSVPYAYWKLDDSGGSTASDSSGNGNTATLFNSPLWLTGANCVANGCLSFNGANQYGSVALDLSTTPAVTLSFWMNWTAYANDDRLAMEFTSNFNNSSIGFMVDPNSSVAGGGQFEVGLQGDAGYNQVVFARPSPGWHHYAFVFNKANPASTEVIPYVDGVAVPYTKTTSSENTNNFGAATLYLMSRGGSSLFGNGALDEVQIYAGALTSSQIQALAAQYAPPQAPTITTTTLPSGTIGVAYSQTLTGTNVASWSVVSGTLPAGLSLNSSTGQIAGTPTTAGTSAFTVQASNSSGSVTQALSIAINSSDSTPPTISITSPTAGQVVYRGTQITLTVSATDNVGVVGVQYILDGVNLGNPVMTAPFSMVWKAQPRGWHTLTAKAWDAAGNTTTSAPVTFRVR
jgi:hypothetical protein